MNSLRRAAICLLLLTAAVYGRALPAAAAEPAARSASLERLPSSPLVLKAPEGVAGDFTVARTAPAIDFAVFPGQWENARLWSSWGDSLFASDGKFYASIGDHGAPYGTSYVYSVDPEKKTVKLVVDYNAVIGVSSKDMYAPGKIHGGVVQADDGRLYLFGYRGSTRGIDAKTGYKGDWLLSYDPSTGETEDLGPAVPHSSVPVLAYVPATKSLYGLSVPGETMPDPAPQFFRYDLSKRKLAHTYRLNVKGPRAMIAGDDGRAWFGIQDEQSEKGVFARYDPQTNSVEPTNVRIPGDGMLRAATSPDKDGVVYCFSKDGVVFAFDTKTEKITELTEAFVGGRQYIATCRLDPAGRYLYYIPRAHGRSSELGTPVIQLDVKSKQRKVIAFLNEFLRKEKEYNLGGTYGIALNADGSQLFVNWNGSKLPLSRSPDFGLCAAMVIHIPESERTAGSSGAGN